MSKSKIKPQKTIQEYRRDIFALKGQLKQEQNHLSELKQQYQDADIFGDTSYSYSMKLKILEYNLNDIRAKLKKFIGEDQYEYYCLNYSTLAMVKSCEVVGITKEMIFRGVDIDGKGYVGAFQFTTFLREVMHLDSQFIGPLMKVLCPDQSKPVTKARYHLFLNSFLIQSQQEEGNTNSLDDSVMRVARELYKQNISPEKIWTVKEVNVAIVVFGLMKAVKNLDVLDCVACYCRCDPLKSGVISTNGVVNMIKQRISDSNSFESGAVKFKLSKN